MEYEDVQEILYNELGFCGCIGVEPLEKIYKCLLWANREDDQEPRVILFNDFVTEIFQGDLGSAYCVLMLLENAYLLEHGVSIRGAWLTEKGLHFFTILQSYLLTDFVLESEKE